MASAPSMTSRASAASAAISIARRGAGPSPASGARAGTGPTTSPHTPPFSAPPSVAETPVIEDGFVTLRETIVTPDHPRGVWQVDGVELVALLELVEEAAPASRVRLRVLAAERTGYVPEAVDGALGWLHHRGMIG